MTRRFIKFETAEKRVRSQWGRGFELLSSSQREALVAAEIFSLAALQDEEEVSDRVVRRIVTDGWAWVHGRYDAE